MAPITTCANLVALAVQNTKQRSRATNLRVPFRMCHTDQHSEKSMSGSADEHPTQIEAKLTPSGIGYRHFRDVRICLRECWMSYCETESQLNFQPMVQSPLLPSVFKESCSRGGGETTLPAVHEHAFYVVVHSPAWSRFSAGEVTWHKVVLAPAPMGADRRPARMVAAHNDNASATPCPDAGGANNKDADGGVGWCPGGVEFADGEEDLGKPTLVSRETEFEVMVPKAESQEGGHKTRPLRESNWKDRNPVELPMHRTHRGEKSMAEDILGVDDQELPVQSDRSHLAGNLSGNAPAKNACDGKQRPREGIKIKAGKWED
ncbi:hypothetical protein K438DRAFT_1759549 [Mycena galopus ATCC 62051]|nr:hypothetical protein K438DRAFT_1759549 [Mycena galopus ATCC 62051]